MNHLAAPQPAGVNAEQIAALDCEYVMGTYARQPVVFVRGEGARLWDSDGREYLDFLAGIAVVQVGHCHPRLAEAIATQAHTLMHVSNLFHNGLQARLAERLVGLSGMEKAFFCNSGAEANEAALKIARKWGKAKRGDDCIEIVTFEGSFHGRTMGAVSATAQPKYQKPFAPLVPGFRYAPRNDMNALSELVTERTCAVMIEPIQGESGINPFSAVFLADVRRLCDEREALLIFDEIQSGMGRTGRFLASQSLTPCACCEETCPSQCGTHTACRLAGQTGAGISADIVTLAKGIADGFPMGVCLARGEAANTLVPGDHGSTFAGQPLACAASLATLDILEDESLMRHAAEIGAYFLSALKTLQSELPAQISEVRGRGFMVGVTLGESAITAKAIQKAMFARGILVNPIGDAILRFVPPLIVTQEDCDRVVSTLRDVLA